MIKTTFSHLANPSFLAGIQALRRAKVPLLVAKQLDKLLPALQGELDRFTADTDEQRKEIFGEIGDVERELLLAWGRPGLEERFRDAGFTPEAAAELRDKYRRYEEYCTELGKQEVKVPGEKLKMADTFGELSYDHLKAIEFLVSLE